MFRNLRLYRLSSGWPETEEELSSQLLNVPFKPCGAYSERSAGWEAVATAVGAPGATADAPASLARRVGGGDLIRLRSQTRLLPPAAINELLDERIAEFASRMMRSPSRKEKRDLKDEVIAELMPRALLKSDRIWGAYIRSENLLAVDTASESQAERFLDQLRLAFGSLPAVPLEFSEPVSKLLTAVFLGGGPPAFQPGRECRMLDPAAGGASVSWMDIDLGEPSVQKHVKEGLKLDRLALGFDEVATLVLDTDGVIRKFKLGGMDQVEDADVLDEDPLGRLDAEFVLVVGTLTRLMGALKRELGGYRS